MENKEHIEGEWIEGFEREIRRGTLVLIVLILLKKPTHGYDLLTRLEQQNVDMDTDTLYPLLRRLETQAMLSSEWETSQARPRKIYRLTEKGEKNLKNMMILWKDYGLKIERMKGHD